jgi:hypothetical protein
MTDVSTNRALAQYSILNKTNLLLQGPAGCRSLHCSLFSSYMYNSLFQPMLVSRRSAVAIVGRGGAAGCGGMRWISLTTMTGHCAFFTT